MSNRDWKILLALGSVIIAVHGVTDKKWKEASIALTLAGLFFKL